MNSDAPPPSPTPIRDPTPRPIAPGTEWIVRGLSRPLNHLWDRGFRFLFVLDAVALIGTMLATTFVRFGRTWPTYSLSFYLGGFAIAAAIHLVINYFYGLYEREPRLGRRAWLPRSIVAMGIGVGIEAIAFVFFDRYLMPRLNLVIFLFAGALMLTLNRRISRWLAYRRQGPPRIVFVGSVPDVARASHHVAATEHEVQIVGAVTSADGLARAAETGRATDVLLLDSVALGDVFPEPMARLEAEGLGFLQRVEARDTLLGLKAVREIAGMPFVPLAVHPIPPHKAHLKRLFDLALCVITAPFSLLTIGVLAVYVLVRAGRPIFFTQARVGKEGRTFTVVKFRTMVVNAEHDGIRLSARDDTRVVPGLRWMRATRADELPQLWNVIRNEMSLVGPRPERPELTSDIERTVAGWVMRHQLPPGLTGLAQVNGRYATNAEYKLGYDLQYIVNWSPILDLQILAQTVWVVISRRV